MHHCYRAIVLLGQVRIPEDLLCVASRVRWQKRLPCWPERYRTMHPVCSACRGKGRVEDPRREEGEEAKA